MTRLATEKDIPQLLEMLADMGQLRSEAAIQEAIEDPRQIVMLRETDGKVDGFCFSRSFSGADAVFGPMDVKTDDHELWLKGVIEMAFSMAWVPSVVGRVDGQVLHFRVWPHRPQLRQYAAAAFEVPNSFTSVQGHYEVEADGAWHFHVPRAWLLKRGAELLTARRHP